jgi:outer membrane lipoprotein-sorting protein
MKNYPFFGKWTGLLLLLLPFGIASVRAQTPSATATEIVRKADENRRGKSLYAEITMTVVRPAWTRETGIKSWSKGEDYSLVLITSPAKDKGQAFLKRQKELWNWVPGIGRMIKMSSSVMGQSWMGSDFTNDDLVKQSSNVNDYTHRLETTEKVREFDCYKVILTPKDDAAVVWGKVIMWISTADFIELKTEFYDEDGTLVNTYDGYDIRLYGRRKLASRMEVVPAAKPGQKTVMTILTYDFDRPVDESFFSQQNMKKLK